ncbi:N-acetyltransferase family protein [Bacillus spongiae]|uniref:N-acetyltransferase family protein n=1 Tax=Bacillus spongiae TaxID=2683610 RepID=A0ABU8HJ24_9BACI
MNKTISITKMQKEDWQEVKDIYLSGIKTGHATFQEDAPSWKEWDKSHLEECRIVARMDEKVIGWAALSPISSRCVYGGVAEVSIYIDELARGKRVGSSLLQELIQKSELAGIWTLQASLFPENEASMILHKKAGFKVVGTRERIGKLKGIWRDVILLERRSDKVGIE